MLSFTYINNEYINKRMESKLVKTIWTVIQFSIFFWKIQYACSAWNPHNKCEIDQLELVQYRTDRLATNRQRNTSSAGDMLQHLNWRNLKDRRIDARLLMMYKIENEKIYLLLEKRQTWAIIQIITKHVLLVFHYHSL